MLYIIIWFIALLIVLIGLRKDNQNLMFSAVIIAFVDLILVVMFNAVLINAFPMIESTEDYLLLPIEANDKSDENLVFITLTYNESGVDCMYKINPGDDTNCKEVSFKDVMMNTGDYDPMVRFHTAEYSKVLSYFVINKKYLKKMTYTEFFIPEYYIQYEHVTTER